MAFTDPFIRRPVLASVVSLLILLLGFQAWNKLQIRQYPQMENALITVTTAYPGANAETIQGYITQPLQQSLASSELATAEDQLAALQAQTPDDPSLEQYQRQLAEAYLQRSQIVLQKGDVNAAATALSRARALMPKAPALTGGVNGAITEARRAELEKAEAALEAAVQR